MASKGNYPSPTHGTGSGPYPDNQDPAMQDMDLSAQLQNAASQGNAHESLGVSVSMDGYGNPYSTSYQFTSPLPAALINGSAVAPQANMGGTMGPDTPTQHHMDGHGQEMSGRRKPKISRACDACRKKKIRCDKDQNSHDACTNCKKSDPDNCIFERIPQKRGPNKGYIKDMNERLMETTARLNNMEEKMNPRKRTSTSAGLDQYESTPPAVRWINVNANIASGPIFAKVFPIPDVANGKALDAGEVQVLQKLDKQVGEHLPFISVKTDHLQPILAASDNEVRQALIQCVEASLLELEPNHNARAEKVTTAYENLCRSTVANVDKRGYTTNLVYLIALTTVIVALDAAGDLKTLGPGVPSSDRFWGETIGLVRVLGLQTGDRPETADGTLGNELYAAGRRIWWALVALDLHKALALCEPAVITSADPVPVDNDRMSIGPTLFELARLALVSYAVLQDMLYAKAHGGDIRRDPEDKAKMLVIITGTTSSDAALPVVEAAQAHLALLIQRLLPLHDHKTGTRAVESINHRLATAGQCCAGLTHLGGVSPFLPSYLGLLITVARELPSSSSYQVLETALAAVVFLQNGWASTLNVAAKTAHTLIGESHEEELMPDLSAEHILGGFMTKLV